MATCFFHQWLVTANFRNGGKSFAGESDCGALCTDPGGAEDRKYFFFENLWKGSHAGDPGAEYNSCEEGAATDSFETDAGEHPDLSVPSGGSLLGSCIS